jgi:hypothetical protein
MNDKAYFLLAILAGITASEAMDKRPYPYVSSKPSRFEERIVPRLEERNAPDESEISCPNQGMVNITITNPDDYVQFVDMILPFNLKACKKPEYMLYVPGNEYNQNYLTKAVRLIWLMDTVPPELFQMTKGITFPHITNVIISVPGGRGKFLNFSALKNGNFPNAKIEMRVEDPEVAMHADSF